MSATPQVNVFDFYRDIRTYGRGHEDYYENASKQGVLFFRYVPEEPPVVQKAAPGNGSPLAVTVKDTLTWGEELGGAGGSGGIGDGHATARYRRACRGPQAGAEP